MKLRAWNPAIFIKRSAKIEESFDNSPTTFGSIASSIRGTSGISLVL
jgi:hypothetical protein